MPALPLANCCDTHLIQPDKILPILPFDQSHTIIQWQQHTFNTPVILAEVVETPQCLAVFSPVRSHLGWEMGIGFRRDRHATSEH